MKLFSFFLSILFFQFALSKSKNSFEGSYVYESGTYIPLYKNLNVDFLCLSSDCSKLNITITYGFGQQYPCVFNWNVISNTKTKGKIPNRLFPTNLFMGLRFNPGDDFSLELVSKPTSFMRGETSFSILEEKVLQGSQGPFNLSIVHSFNFSTTEDLVYTIQRNSRKVPIIFNMKKTTLKEKQKKIVPSKEKPSSKTSSSSYVRRDPLIYEEGRPTAYFIETPFLDHDWTLNGTVDEKILLISIAGLVNAHGANLYLLYPKDFVVNIVHETFDFYNEYHYNFVELKTIEDVLNHFAKELKELSGTYVVWDETSRTSSIVSFTAASYNHSIILSERLRQKYSSFLDENQFTKTYDFRDSFFKELKQNDLKFYQWAKKEFWVSGQTNTNYIQWLGGICGNQIKPAIADFGMSRNMFYSDLSTKKGSEEYSFASELLDEMNSEDFVVLGWHSYCKDLERDFTTLTSSKGGRVHGLNSYPNLSFGNQVPLTEGFVFKNHHSPNVEQLPEEKVYVAGVQTDGIGLGAWGKPGRGGLPYSWEVTMDDYVLRPSLLEMFYRNATKNDFMIAGLSSPGYMYPKACPPARMVEVMKYSNELFEKLDLNVMAVMDYSEGSTVVGNTDLPKSLIDLYFEYLPNAIGFSNGYSPSYTFAIDEKTKVPFLSYDYYLDPDVTVEDAINDLLELSIINPKRPYYNVIHVREYSGVDRVKEILDALVEKDNFEVTQLDTLLKMAGKKFTSRVRYENDK